MANCAPLAAGQGVQYHDVGSEGQVTQDHSAVLAKVQDIPEGGVIECQATVAGAVADLLLMRAGESVRAFHNVCPHAGRSLNWAPGKFLIESGLLICAAHGASFSIPEGRCVLGPCRGQALSEVAVEISGEEVLLVPTASAPSTSAPNTSG